MRRIHINDVADHQPIEQHTERGQVLLDRGRRKRFFLEILVLQVLDECGDMEGLDAGEFSDAVRLAPLRKATRRIQIRLARVVVLDLSGENSNTRLAALGVGVKSGAGCRLEEGEGMSSLLMELNEASRCRPNSVVNVSGGSERRLLELVQVCRRFSSGVFYRLTNDPATLVDKDRAVMYLAAGSQLERPAGGAHLRDGFDISADLVSEDPDRHAGGDLVDVKIEHFLIEVGIDDEEVLGSALNEGTQVAVKIVAFARFIHALNFFFRKLQPKYGGQAP